MKHISCFVLTTVALLITSGKCNSFATKRYLLSSCSLPLSYSTVRCLSVVSSVSNREHECYSTVTTTRFELRKKERKRSVESEKAKRTTATCFRFVAHHENRRRCRGRLCLVAYKRNRAACYTFANQILRIKPDKMSGECFAAKRVVSLCVSDRPKMIIDWSSTTTLVVLLRFNSSHSCERFNRCSYGRMATANESRKGCGAPKEDGEREHASWISWRCR